MARKGGSLSVNTNINQHSSYYYYGLLFLGIILLLLLFKIVGETLYYRGPRAKPTPTPKPSTTPTPTSRPSSTPTSSTPTPTSNSMIKPNVLPVATLSPTPTPTNNFGINLETLAVIRGRLIDLGDNYDKLTNEDKKEVALCYANPKGCQF